jgi:hypothetical protein
VSFSFLQKSDIVLTCPAARANHHLQRYELLEQGHVAMRIMFIRATMDVTGRVVLLNRSPSRAGRCYQSVGMVERYQRIILGVNLENWWRHGTSRAQRLLGGMVTDRLIRARHQRIVTACVKQELSPQQHQARQ